MKKMTMVIIGIVMLITITLGSITTILLNDKYHLKALVLLNGWEICELTDDEITFITDKNIVSVFNFGYGIEQIKKGTY